MRHKFLLVIILFVQLLTSCYYSHPTNNDDWSANNGNGVDSLEFLLGHHYWRNYFFAATDSIKLVAGMSPEKNFYPKDFNSERILKKGDVVGVMDVRMDRREQPAVAWVKVARDQACQGAAAAPKTPRAGKGPAPKISKGSRTRLMTRPVALILKGVRLFPVAVMTAVKIGLRMFRTIIFIDFINSSTKIIKVIITSFFWCETCKIVTIFLRCFVSLFT